VTQSLCDEDVVYAARAIVHSWPIRPADQFALDARWRLDGEFEWGCCGVRALENLGAAFYESLFDAGDDTAST
jgi:hypothetical protein